MGQISDVDASGEVMGAGEDAWVVVERRASRGMGRARRWIRRREGMVRDQYGRSVAYRIEPDSKRTEWERVTSGGLPLYNCL